MISKSKKFIFIHVPKTGGNSIQNILLNYSDDYIIVKEKTNEGLIERFEISGKIFGIHKHSTGAEYRRLWNSKVYGDYNDYYKFGVIRNPWERLISLYFTKNADRAGWNRGGFISLIKNKPLQWRPMSDFLSNAGLNKIIKFENINDEFAEVCSGFNIASVKLPHLNKTNRGHYTEYYDQELLDIVYKYYRDDINNFNYKFGS